MILRLLFLLFFSSFFSQKNPVFVYQLKFKKDSLSSDYISTKQVLLINKDESKFFDYSLYEIDSINRKRSDGRVQKIRSKAGLELLTSFKGFKNFKTSNNDYYVYDSTENLVWNLNGDLKNFKNFVLQKATTEFGGRKWIAWFCKEMPISFGPYKFHGLPGLIFELYDEKRNYLFQLQEVRNSPEIDTRNFLETNHGSPPILISLQDYKNKMLEMYENPVKQDIEDSHKYNYKIDFNINEKIKERRELLKKNNNPLDLSAAIPYPPK